MSFNPLGEPEKLDAFLKEIRALAPHEDIHANPYFYLVKPTEDNLFKYRFKCSDSRLAFYFAFLKVLAVISLRIMNSLLLSLLLFRKSKVNEFHELNSCKYLFLSHFTYAQDPKVDDIFFGKNLNIFRSFTFYLNHTRKSVHRILQEFHKVGKTNVYINSKFLPLTSMLRLQYSQLKKSWWIISTILTKRNLELVHKRILLQSAVYQHSRPTIANLVLRHRLEDLVRDIKPEFIVMTVEGHAHEAMILKMRNMRFQRTRILGYQHAPVVPAQYNFSSVVSLFGTNDLLLTSGEATRKSISRAAARSPIAVLGSPKSRKYEFCTKATSRIQVLVAPEASKLSLNSFIQILNEVSPQLPDVNFVMRPHPDLDLLSRRMMKKFLVENPNVSVSKSTKHQDLSSSHLILFRSSALAVEALSYSTLPIHMNYRDIHSLNPFAFVDVEITALSTADELVSAIKNIDIKMFQKESFQAHCFKQFSNYFSEFQSLDALIS